MEPKSTAKALLALLAGACSSPTATGESAEHASTSIAPTSSEITDPMSESLGTVDTASTTSGYPDDTSEPTTSTGTSPDLPACEGEPSPPDNCRSCSIAVDWSELPSAVAMEDQIRVVPVGPTLRVPPTIAPFMDDPNYAFLTRDALDAAKDGTGEWNTEYAAIANGLLDYDYCGAHVGSESWPGPSGSWMTMFLRVYVLPESADTIEARVTCLGPALAEAHGGLEPEVEVTSFGGWRRVRLSFGLVFIDYGGTTMLDLFLQENCDSTSALLFMHSLWDAPANAEAEIAQSVGDACFANDSGVECCS